MLRIGCKQDGRTTLPEFHIVQCPCVLFLYPLHQLIPLTVWFLRMKVYRGWVALVAEDIESQVTLANDTEASTSGYNSNLYID